jgi:hypothetical protein
MGRHRRRTLTDSLAQIASAQPSGSLARATTAILVSPGMAYDVGLLKTRSVNAGTPSW